MRCGPTLRGGGGERITCGLGGGGEAEGGGGEVVIGVAGGGWKNGGGSGLTGAMAPPGSLGGEDGGGSGGIGGGGDCICVPVISLQMKSPTCPLSYTVPLSRTQRHGGRHCA